MSCLYRVILIFCIAAAIMFLPQPAQAQQSSPLVPKGDRTIQQSAEDLFKHGVYEALTGNYRVAIEDFTQVIHLRPDDVTAYINQGIARDKQGRVFYWRPLVTKEQAQMIEAHEKLHKFLAVSNPDVVAAFADSLDYASIEQLEAIAQRIQAARRKREEK